MILDKKQLLSEQLCGPAINARNNNHKNDSGITFKITSYHFCSWTNFHTTYQGKIIIQKVLETVGKSEMCVSSIFAMSLVFLWRETFWWGPFLLLQRRHPIERDALPPYQSKDWMKSMHSDTGLYVPARCRWSSQDTSQVAQEFPLYQGLVVVWQHNMYMFLCPYSLLRSRTL